MNIEEQDEISAVIERLNLPEPEGDPEPLERESEAEAESESEVEATGEGKDEEIENEAPSSKRFAALARREARIVRERQAVKSERERLNAERQQLKQLSELPALAKNDPLAALEALGLSPDELTAALLNGVSTEAQTVTRAELAEMEQRLKAEREQLDLDRQIKAFRQQIDEHIKGNPESYELLNLQGKSSLVFEVIEEAYKQHQRILDVAEAAQMVEDHLEEEASKLLSAKKIGAKRQSANPTPKRKSIAGMGATSTGKLAPVDAGDPDEADFQRAINAFHKARQR